MRGEGEGGAKSFYTPLLPPSTNSMREKKDFFFFFSGQAIKRPFFFFGKKKRRRGKAFLRKVSIFLHVLRFPISFFFCFFV